MDNIGLGFDRDFFRHVSTDGHGNVLSVAEVYLIYTDAAYQTNHRQYDS